MSDLDSQYKVFGRKKGRRRKISFNKDHFKIFKQASSVAFSIANSQLVKTAIAGQDANWGRIIMAIGKVSTKVHWVEQVQAQNLPIILENTCRNLLM